MQDVYLTIGRSLSWSAQIITVVDFGDIYIENLSSDPHPN